MKKINDLNCYEVVCIDTHNIEHVVRVMTTDEKAAMKSAEYSLLEGSHVKATAKNIRKVDSI